MGTKASDSTPCLLCSNNDSRAQKLFSKRYSRVSCPWYCCVHQVSWTSRVLALSYGHSLLWLGQTWMWVSVTTEETKIDASLWSSRRHGLIHACAGELAGMGTTLKPSHISSAAWVETRHCVIWLRSATCTGSSNSPVCFEDCSLTILDFLLRPLSSSASNFLKQSRTCSLLYHMHHL